MSENITPAADSHSSKLANLCSIKAFIGREFLTWLWYRVESPEQLLKVYSATEKKTYHLDLWIEDYLIFESPSSMTHTQTLRGGTPSQSIEATAALKTGKFLKQMKIGMSIDGFGEFTATLTDNDLFPRGLKFIRLHDDESQIGDNLLNRLKMVETFLTVFDLLYQEFIATRTKDSWETVDAKKIRHWIGSRYFSQMDSRRNGAE